MGRHGAGGGTSEDVYSKVCLFVRNIPFSVTDSELEKVFEPYGALAACFTVKDKGKPI